MRERSEARALQSTKRPNQTPRGRGKQLNGRLRPGKAFKSDEGKDGWELKAPYATSYDLSCSSGTKATYGRGEPFMQWRFEFNVVFNPLCLRFHPYADTRNEPRGVKGHK